MMKISITVSDDIIHILPSHDIEQIDKTLENVRDLLAAMMDKSHRQLAYQKRFNIMDDEIVQDFNSDMLRIAVGVRGADIVDSEGLIDDMLNHRINPSLSHLEYFASGLRFPISFFTREYEIQPIRFMCSHVGEHDRDMK